MKIRVIRPNTYHGGQPVAVGGELDIDPEAGRFLIVAGAAEAVSVAQAVAAPQAALPDPVPAHDAAQAVAQDAAQQSKKGAKTNGA